ncbi:MAG: hypothetical protein LBM67_03555 [Lentimicrobiaceae bacterium]|jgi:hypothetical protein|nr:hypothetical protein [Lentimicrobiaceae bacterium]
MKKFFSLVLSVILLSSCASILSGTKAKVQFDDHKVKRVDLTVDGEKHPNMNLPATVKVRRGFKDSKVIAEAEGYDPSTIDIHKNFNATTLVNILIGGIFGIAIDAATGAMMKPSSKFYNLGMCPTTSGNYVKDPTIVADEATNRVSRDNPGATALERTIIRWYFDSAPRGARIFWRVISSVPDQVKNTNELYLTTTPYEETRSFNISGLTYENSRDVTIEIKLSMPGYHDQVKRYNVRQAIDQQEISGFFDMVQKKEE